MAGKTRRARVSGGVRGGKGVSRTRGEVAGPPAGATGGGIDELVDMDQAVKMLRTSRPTFYRWLREGKLKGLKLGRQWRFSKGDIERFIRGEAPRIELRADIGPLIGTLRRKLAELGVKPGDLRSDSPVAEAASLMIWVCSAMKASDLHIEPHMNERSGEPVARLRCRVDGVLHLVAEFDLRLLPAVVERWMTMANVDLNEKRRCQDGRIMVELAGRRLDLRVNFLPACTGEAVTARILDPKDVQLSLDKIDYSPRDREVLLRALASGHGTVITTGPTGSGKTTVLYACLNQVSGPEVKTITIEDPVEYFLPWALQVQVLWKYGLGFPQAMRAAFRSDPDVILVGELRDLETLQLVHQAALTGHLVLTSLHAEDAASALIRMVEMGSDPFIVADATRAILAQRLVRRLCPVCSREEAPPKSMLARAEELAGGRIEGAFRVPVGCPECGKLGYRRRTVIAEVLEVTPEIGGALRRRASVGEIRDLAVSQGMTTMALHGLRRAAAGETTLEEVFRTLGLS